MDTNTDHFTPLMLRVRGKKKCDAILSSVWFCSSRMEEGGGGVVHIFFLVVLEEKNHK